MWIYLKKIESKHSETSNTTLLSSEAMMCMRVQFSFQRLPFATSTANIKHKKHKNHQKTL
jgi:hypothetical protein